MADISTELGKLRSAGYGEEVRGSMISAITKMNEEAEHAEAWATGGSGGTPSADNNAQHYAELANARGKAWADGTKPDGTALPDDDPAKGNSAKDWAEAAAATASGMAAVDGAVGAAMILNDGSNGPFPSGTQLFTISDVSVGDTIWYDITTPASIIATIRLYTEGGDVISEYGNKNPPTEETHYIGSFTIPPTFGYCAVYANSNKTVAVKYIARSLDNRVTALETEMNSVRNAAPVVGLLAFGDYGRYAQLFTIADVSVGDTISYDITAPSDDTGYIETLDAQNQRLHMYGKTAADQAAHAAGSFVIDEDFALARVVVNGSKTLAIKYLYKQPESGGGADSTRVEALENIAHEFKALKIGTFGNNATIFTSADVSPGDILHYDFTSPTGASYGYISFQNSSDAKLHFWLYGMSEVKGQPSAGTALGRNNKPDDRGHYTGAVIIPHGFHHCVATCTSGYPLNIAKLYVDHLEQRCEPDEMDIPQYYFEADGTGTYSNYMPQKVEEINAVLEANMAYGDAFLFATDIHHRGDVAAYETYYPSNLYNQFHTPALMNYIRKRTCVNKVIVGGDLVHVGGKVGEQKQARAYMSLIRQGFGSNVHFMIGNHDTFASNPTSRNSTYADAASDDFNGNSLHHYYYFDNKRVKIRYIILADYYSGTNTENGLYADTVQQDWFWNALMTMEDGWGAVVLTHTCYSFQYEVWSDADGTYLPGDMLMHRSNTGRLIMGYCDAYNSRKDRADGTTPITAHGEVIAIVQGHTHVDRVIYTDGSLPGTSATVTGGIPVIITTSDQNMGCYGTVGETDPAKIHQPNVVFDPNADPPIPPRVTGTIREQAFDAIVINRNRGSGSTGTIYAIRVGCEAYDGVGAGSAQDLCFGSATQMRTITFPERFSTDDIWGTPTVSLDTRVAALEEA